MESELEEEEEGDFSGKQTSSEEEQENTNYMSGVSQDSKAESVQILRACSKSMQLQSQEAARSQQMEIDRKESGSFATLFKNDKLPENEADALGI